MRLTALTLLLALAAGCATGKTDEFKQNPPTLGDKSYQMAEHYYRLGNLESADRRYRTALAEYQKRDRLDRMVAVYNRLGELNLTRGDADTAAGYLLSAQTICRHETMPAPCLRTDLNLANLYLHRGDLTKTKEALDALEGDRRTDKARLYNLKGLYAMAMKKYARAEEHFKNALKTAEKDDNTGLRSSAHGNLGALFLRRGKASAARPHLEKALELDKRMKLPAMIGQDLHMLGQSHELMGEYDTAAFYYNRALQVNRLLDLKERVLRDHHALERLSRLMEKEKADK